MILVRAWRRELLGGVSAALIVPAALVAAVVLLGLAGGFSGLGALGQAFSGPSLPLAASGVATGAHRAGTISTAALVALPAPRVAAGAPATAAQGSRPAPRVRSDTRLPTAARRGGRTGQPAATRSPSPPGQTTPGPHPTVSDEVVGTATSVTGQVPGPAGPAASGALQSAGSTVDSIAPVPAPGSQQQLP